MEKPKLPKELGEPWVKALRSGEYEQTTGQLERGGRYCCLGVYCKVNNIKLFIDGISAVDFRGYSFLDKYLGSQMVTELYLLNDAGGSSFNQIANYIEENIEFV